MSAYDLVGAPTTVPLDPGGEYYFSNGVGSAWNNWAGLIGNGCVSNAPAGRSTTYAIEYSGNNPSFFVQRGFPVAYSSWCVGGAFYYSGQANNGVALVSFLDPTGNSQNEVRVTAAGNAYFTRNGTLISGTSTGIVPVGWNYLQVKSITNGTTGFMEITVNGVALLTLSGANTQGQAGSTVQFVKYGPAYSGNIYLKDMYWMADTGSGPFTNYLGDITVPVYYPNAAGVNQAWALGAGSSQTAAVQDGINHTGTWPDGDTTYIDSATAGQISDFAHQSATVAPLAVVNVGYMRKDDAGTRQVALVCLSAATEHDSPNLSLGNTYAYYCDVLDTDPHTAAAWTLTGFNNATFGVKEIS